MIQLPLKCCDLFVGGLCRSVQSFIICGVRINVEFMQIPSEKVGYKIWKMSVGELFGEGVGIIKDILANDNNSHLKRLNIEGLAENVDSTRKLIGFIM